MDFDLVTDKDLFGVPVNKKYDIWKHHLKDTLGYYMNNLFPIYLPNVQHNISFIIVWKEGYNPDSWYRNSMKKHHMTSVELIDDKKMKNFKLFEITIPMSMFPNFLNDMICNYDELILFKPTLVDFFKFPIYSMRSFYDMINTTKSKFGYLVDQPQYQMTTINKEIRKIHYITFYTDNLLYRHLLLCGSLISFISRHHSTYQDPLDNQWRSMVFRKSDISEDYYNDGEEEEDDPDGWDDILSPKMTGKNWQNTELHIPNNKSATKEYLKMIWDSRFIEQIDF